VLAGQDLQLLTPTIGELEMHATLVQWVALAADQSSDLRALSELDGAVVADVQCLRCLPDRWSRSCGMAADDQQQLVQRGGEACAVRGLLQRRNSRSWLRNASRR
jgi:hypothetical protein